MRCPPLQYYLERVLRDIGGGISHWASKVLPRKRGSSYQKGALTKMSSSGIIFGLLQKSLVSARGVYRMKLLRIIHYVSWGPICWPFLRSPARAPTTKAVRGSVAIQGFFDNKKGPSVPVTGGGSVPLTGPSFPLTILTQMMADEFNFPWSEIQDYIAEADADLISVPGQLELHGWCRCGVLLTLCFGVLSVADLILGMED